MPRDLRGDSTRRRFLGTGIGVGLAGVFAGCIGGNDAGSNGDGTNGTDGPGDGATETDAATAESATDGSSTESTTGGTTERGGSYSVAMEPVGSVTFDGVPRKWFPYTGDYADMGVALGQASGLSAVGVRARYGSHLYDGLPGVSVDESDLTELYQDGTGKEVFYELDADVHLVDPNFMVNRLEWDRADIDEITEQVAPFFGNTVFTRVYGWHDYADYTMYEAFEKMAAVFEERARYEAFRQHHDEVLTNVKNRLPNRTPSVATVYPADVPPESFYPYRIGTGTQSKHWRDLNVEDALANEDVTDAQAGGSTLDFETLLDIDPDVLAVRLQGKITDQYFEQNIVTPLENDEVASRLTAVQNDRVVYGGLTYQGPIIYLFQLERAAKAIYPDAFGGEQLFDRKRVADIVTEGR